MADDVRTTGDGAGGNVAVRTPTYRGGPAILGTEGLSAEDASAFAKAGPRAFFIGVALVAFQAWVTPYVEHHMHGTYLTLDHLPKGPIIALFLLVMVVNVFLLLHRMSGLEKALVVLAVNAILIFAYAIYFRSAVAVKAAFDLKWWLLWFGMHACAIIAVNAFLVARLWESAGTRVVGGLLFNAAMLVVIGTRLYAVRCAGAEQADLAPMDVYDLVSLGFQFAMLAGANLLLWSKPLDRAELLVVYCMVLVGAMIPNMGLMGYLIPVTAGYRYYATPENNWQACFYDHAPPWISPRDPAGVGALDKPMPVRWLFEGVPQGRSIPWGEWLMPLLWWSALAILIYLTMTCLAVILRKQWIDRERLPFPLAQVPLAMAEGAESGSFLTPFFRSRLMWIGFAFPFVIHSLITLHDIWPGMPTDGLIRYLRYGGWDGGFDSDYLTDPPWSWLKPVWIMIYPSVVGLTYLLSLEVAFSLWFFYWISKLETVFAVMMGYAQNQWNMIEAKDGALAFQNAQGTGALLAMVIVGFYMARGHIWDVVKRALGLVGVTEVDDTNEPFSYRFTFFGLLAGLAGTYGMYIWAGMGPLMALGMVVLFVILFVGLTRLVVEGGLNYVQSWGTSYYLMRAAIGTKPIGPANLTAGTFIHSVFHFDLRAMLMPSIINSFKITSEGRVRRRYMGLAVVTAIIVALVLSPIAFLKASYETGGARLNAWFFVQFPPAPFNTLVRDIKTDQREALTGAEASVEAVTKAVAKARESGTFGKADVDAIECAATAASTAVVEYRAVLAIRASVINAATAVVKFKSGSAGIASVKDAIDDLDKTARESLKGPTAGPSAESGSEELDVKSLVAAVGSLKAPVDSGEDAFRAATGAADEEIAKLDTMLRNYEVDVGLLKVKRLTEDLRSKASVLWSAQGVEPPEWSWFKPDRPQLVWMGIGAAVMTLFLFLRQRIFWWPHPIGYVCFTNCHAMMKLWFSIFIGWALKLCIIKYGGFRIYYKMRDFFIGLIVGEMMAGGWWIFIKFLLGLTSGWQIDIN